MRFEQALQAMREGKKVKLPEDDVCFGMNEKNLVYFRKVNEDFYMFGINALRQRDILSEDWEIVDE